MPNDPGQEIAPTQNRGVAAVFQADLDAYTPNLIQALPSHVSVEKFKRVLVTAVSSNPDLLYANRRTLFNAAVRCASDGLIPDGREAALVVYRTRMKRRNPQTGLDIEEYVDAVQCMPMVAGIRKRMRNTGEVLSADAHVVYANDRFKFKLGDDGFIDHEPAGLSEDPGKPLGAYAIIKLKSGEVLRDVLRLSDIEKARAVSRAKDGPMWTKFWDEAARKTALRRCAKSAPQSAELEALLIQGEEDEPPMVPAFEPLPALSHEPEPMRPVEPESIDDRPVYTVVDLDGVEHEFREAETAGVALARVLAEAQRQGPERLAGARESNTGEGLMLAPPPPRKRQRHPQSRTLPEMRAEQEAAQQAVERDNATAEAMVTAGQPWPLDDPTTREEVVPDAPRLETEAPGRDPGAAPRAPGLRVGMAITSPDPRLEGHVITAILPGALDRLALAVGEPQNDDPDRGSLAIEPPIRRGKPDYKTWMIALLLPKVRQAQDARHLAFLLGDNDEHLAQARRELARDDLAALEEAIATRWREIGQ